MAADLSRVRHHPFFDWAGIELKQGGVLLDADANELVAVLDRRLRALASDVLGRATVSSTTADAFRITAGVGGLNIGRGRLYVDGLLAESHGGGAAQFDALMAEPRRADALTYATQPYLPSPPALPQAGRHLVYLDVWNREVTHLEAPELVEGAVGVETSARVQTVWQVRVLADEAGPATCGTPDAELPGWAAQIAPSGGRLSTGTFEVPPLENPCELPPTGGYRGLENQLYRIEIHDPGQPGAGATFKWSRDNASVGSRVAGVVSAAQLELDSLGRDDVLCFSDGHWVEITDDVRELAQAAGEMRRITVDAATRRIGFTPALPAPMVAAGFAARNLRVRRWDQGGRIFRADAGGGTTQVQDLDGPGSSGVIDMPAAGTTLLLEHGLTVSFSSAGANGFKAGDWWVVAARTADASVEQLSAAPPRGIHHHYARLGLWDVATGAVTDCRNPWPPRTQGTDCGCTECVTPESHASGQLTIQAAVDRVSDRGGTVCLHTGSYALDAPVRVVGTRSLAIRGQGPATVITAPGTAFELRNALALAVEKLALISLGDAPAITLRTLAGVRLADLVVAVLGDGAAVALTGLCAGVTIRDNVVIAPEGIRTDTSGEQAARFALTAALAIERNILWCRRAGIVLVGLTAHWLGHRVCGNELLGCRDGAIGALGFALPGAAMRIDANGLNVNGPGIVCGIDGAWIEGNKLAAAPARGAAAITLGAGWDPNGSDQAHVLANQISGFGGAAIAVLAPTAQLIIKHNIIEDCGLGIVMDGGAASDAISIENNHLRNLRGEPDGLGLVAGISVLRADAATIAGNRVSRVAPEQARGALTVGVLALAVQRPRIRANEVIEIGPSGDFVGIGAGIMVRAPYALADVQHNHVQRDAAGPQAGGDTSWLALMIEDGLGAVAAPGASIGAVVRAGAFASLRIDQRRTLVLAGARAFVVLAPLEFDAAGAAVARGATACVLGNTLFARGRGPAVIVVASGDTMFSDNRVDQPDNHSTEAVRITSPVVVASANRVRGGEISLRVTNTSRQVAAVGNVTSGPIFIGGDVLPAPYDALNVALNLFG